MTNHLQDTLLVCGHKLLVFVWSNFLGPQLLTDPHPPHLVIWWHHAHCTITHNTDNGSQSSHVLKLYMSLSFQDYIIHILKKNSVKSFAQLTVSTLHLAKLKQKGIYYLLRGIWDCILKTDFAFSK